MTARPSTLFVAGLLAALTANPGGVCRAEPEAAPSLEEQLLEDLRADPLDEDVHRELFDRDGDQTPAGTSPADESDSPGPEELNEQLLRELGAAVVSEQQNPLLDVARTMRMVEGRIGQTDSGPGTQQMQEDIVARLEELLKQARSRCSAQSQPSPNQKQQVASRRQMDQPKQQKPSQAGQKPSSKAPRDPQTKPGTSQAQRPDMGEMRDLLKRVWGELPAGQREQMLELPVEEFLPKYELLIEAYFKRLAEPQETDRWPAEDFPSP